MVSYISGRWWRWKFRNVLSATLLLICITKSVLSCQDSCNEVLTASEGTFTSPCYPSDYPPNKSCAWTLQAPAGFILRITFLDFELEEAHGCIYDRVIIDTGTGATVKFCGLTANGLALNSTGNVMVVSFNSDFSVQKKGFSIRYSQVAVALRNQKVTLPQNSKDVIRVASTVSIPVLNEFTICFEIARLSQKGTETIFSYFDASKGFKLAFGSSGNVMELTIAGTKCSINDLITSTDFTSQMQLFCLTWSKSNGNVSVNFRGTNRSKICPSTVNLTVDSGGFFEVGSSTEGQNFNGMIYNFRLWNFAKTSSDLSALTCDVVGSVVDWDNSFWDIPPSYAQTDSNLSCICYPHCIHLTTTASSSGTSIPYTTPQTTSCASSGLGCPAPLITTAPSTVTTNTIPTNATTNEKERAVFLWSLLRLPLRSTALPTTSLPSRPPVVPAGRSSKTFLGFISTPLIWPVRKKPYTAITRAQKRPTIHLTKPPSLPTKSVTKMSPDALTSVENSNLTTRKPAYSQVLWPHNQTDDHELYQVASLGNRKNKPWNKPQWVPSDNNKNSSETLDYSSGFGPEAFLYDIDLDDDVFSLFDFDSTYSLDESLATVVPLNMSLLEMGSEPTASTSAPDDIRKAVNKRENLQNQSDSTLSWTLVAQTSEQVSQSSGMLISSSVPASGGTSVQMNPLGLSTVNGQMAEPPSIAVLALSSSNLLDSELLSTVGQSLSEAAEGTFYRISVIAKRTEDQAITEEAMAQWFNQTFQNWTYTVYVGNLSIYPLPGTDVSRYNCSALLMYRNTTGKDLTSTEIKTRLNKSSASNLVFDDVIVDAIENCQAEEEQLHYKWPETRPSVTQYIPCFPYKEQNASRTCIISTKNFTSMWGPPNFSNCKDIEAIEVSQENAAEVAVQLADITNNELTTVEVSKVVTMVKKLVNVARINATLATTVVTIISNVMITSDTAQMAASGTALKTMDELMQKIEFDGPSLTISSKNLAVGISALNISNFNGTSFSAFIPPNTTDPQIHFESEIRNPLATVTLPATLLHNLSTADIETISRINFMFFSKTGLFQDQQSNGLSLNSYVVASSVGNLSISNLRDPVQIEISHLEYQWNPKPLCVFWDFILQNGSGGWNSEGCEVSPESNSNRTICLCSHLTHFGILMDISGASAQIDEKNTKILTFITYIGCGISAIFSAVTLLTYIAFEKLRRDYPSKILMNLSTSLLFLNMVFLLDGWLASYNMEGLCVAVAVFLHFFLLTSFTWMGLESIHMYIALVKVFNTYIRRYILKFCIVGWGLPAAIVGIVVAVNKDSYGKEYYGKGENGQGSSEFCWIRSKVVFYVTCVAYFSIIFLMNVAMFIVVMMQICGRNGKRTNRTLREEVLRNLRSVVSLTFLLGMTWGFAFFAWGPVNLAFMYLFSIFNSLQGLFIFIFHCALKENVQKQWRRYLCCGKFRLADNSDWSKTATNNTKKVSSDNLGKSLSSSSFGSTTANWTSKAKTTLNPFAKRHSSAGKGYSNQCSPKCSTSDVDASTSSILPVHQVLDKVKGYCSVRSDNFYKNIIMSDSFSHSTKF
ncbi:adhesion G-protein coupled receptor G6 isoform X2 [Salminus brasiliensis]|uniref:adhesion G-protein coupled receptor G6 isoform X2 n=1 Tax=Salminus brasiliensis TaxID=930266 RepID=UPI003B839ED8